MIYDWQKTVLYLIVRGCLSLWFTNCGVKPVYHINYASPLIISGKNDKNKHANKTHSKKCDWFRTEFYI